MLSANAATISGLPSDFDMDDEFESDSEIEDEADEDSNGAYLYPRRAGCWVVCMM